MTPRPPPPPPTPGRQATTAIPFAAAVALRIEAQRAAPRRRLTLHSYLRWPPRPLVDCSRQIDFSQPHRGSRAFEIADRWALVAGSTCADPTFFEIPKNA